MSFSDPSLPRTGRRAPNRRQVIPVGGQGAEPSLPAHGALAASESEAPWIGSPRGSSYRRVVGLGARRAGRRGAAGRRASRRRRALLLAPQSGAGGANRDPSQGAASRRTAPPTPGTTSLANCTPCPPRSPSRRAAPCVAHAGAPATRSPSPSAYSSSACASR